MKCDDCDGEGTCMDGIRRVTCFSCNGMGRICDCCGEAVDEPGQDFCELWEEDEN